jgi:3-hydroxybutyrate dehydrogenase
MTPPNFHMKGKTALITGSTDGLGLAIAEGLAAAGCHIVLHGLETDDAMQETLKDLRRRHEVDVFYVRADLMPKSTADDPTAALFDKVLASVKSVDILVNNAVIRHFAGIETFSLQHWNEALAVNLTAAFRAIQLALPGMRAKGWGRIFNMTSVYGSRAVANRVDYVTTKTALLGLTRSVATECISDGITCNAICPGSVLTPNIDGRINTLMQDENLSRDAAVTAFLQGKQPNGQLVEASHVADMVVFLCSASGSQINGAMMPIEGGWLAS